MVLSLFPLQVAMRHTQLAPFKSMPILRPLGAATELTSVMMIDELPAIPPTYVCLCYMCWISVIEVYRRRARHLVISH
ncbi:hypothetical protein M405DRAFT_811344 [Rhizopogon salebrosus TDB-379]|nr:hypothetical protein M405DRAFT_811344 [Rhizopogon salebrosus TDB-379]